MLREFMIVLKPIKIYITKTRQTPEVEELKKKYSLEEGEYVIGYEVKYTAYTPTELVEHVLKIVQSRHEVVEIRKSEHEVTVFVKPVRAGKS